MVRRVAGGADESARGAGMTLEDRKATDAVAELIEDIRASKSKAGRIEVTVCEGKAAEVRIVQIGKARIIKALN